MNIIFGKEQAELLSNTHTVLELDTFQFGIDGPIIPAYCVIETIHFKDMPTLVETRTKHQELITAYQTRQWQTALELLNTLIGAWNGEIDSFYQEINNRVQNFQSNEPDSSWTHIIIKNVS